MPALPGAVRDRIHVVLSFDDAFWAPAYAVMRSACLSSKRRRDMVFHLLHMPLSEEHRADLEAITSEFGAELRWYPLAEQPIFDAFTAGLKTSAQWPRVVYARLLLGELLPPDLERVLYLDCDMLVRRPLEELFDTDLEGKPIGAVLDTLHPFIMGRRDMRENPDIFDLADPYFNSGLMLVDMAGWRAMDVRGAMGELATRGWLARLQYDQDMLNIIFRGRWKALPWRWNTMDAHRAHETLNPAILHFTGLNKPWALTAGIRRSTAYARWYRHVMTNALFYRFARQRWKRWWLKRLPFGAGVSRR